MHKVTWMLVASIPALSGAAAAQRSPSPFLPVRIESCAAADSLLGPLASDGAVVRADYFADVDSTRLVAGREFAGYMPAEQTRPTFTVMTSYRGHKPTTYPHANVSVLITGQDARRLGSDSVAPVVLMLDQSPYRLDSVPIRLSPGPLGPSMFFTLKVPPNLFFALANAQKATFLFEKVRGVLSLRELRDIRGLYRVALCGYVPS